MTPTETDALITKHLGGWLESPANSPTLRERIAAMIAEAESARDKLWRDGAETLKHERDRIQELRNGDSELIRALAEAAGILITAPNTMLGTQWEQFHDGVMTLWKQRDELRVQLAAMTTARDEAIAAAHLEVEPPAAREPRDLVLLIEKIQSIAPDLRDALEIIRVNAMYTAPEAMSVWWHATANALEMKAANHPERDQIQAIFGGTAP